MGASSLLLAAVAALLTGCGSGDDVMANMALPASESANAGAGAQAGSQPPPLAAPPTSDAHPSTLVVTGQQRAYLDALAAGGVRPSSDLLALSIGSYVCQARAARQSEAAVWDFVLPLVRGDVHNSHSNSMAPTASDVNAATAGYIRIATEKLC
jgi:hypothetical protein